MHTTLSEAKSAAAALRRRLGEDGISLSHSRALEIVAAQLGHADWNTAHAALTRAGTLLGAPVPVLRIHDQEIARHFYLDYLAFDVVGPGRRPRRSPPRASPARAPPPQPRHRPRCPGRAHHGDH